MKWMVQITYEQIWKKKRETIPPPQLGATSGQWDHYGVGLSSHVFNLPILLEESLDPVRVPLGFDTVTNIVEEIFQVHVLLIMDYHFV
jgi:hypothetical protein